MRPAPSPAAWTWVRCPVDVNQFYGIEIGEFPARIAEVALWMMDHLMNNELSLEFGQSYARIPLKQSPHIRCADALEMDWEDLLPAKDCSFVFGNPAVRGRQVPVSRAAGAGAPDRGARWERRDARLRDRLVHHGGWVHPGQRSTGGTRADRLRGDELDHPGRAGGAALADPVRPVGARDRLRAPDVRLGLRREGHGARARRHHRAG